ncbi:hypothetical protein [Breoghania sp.]|uniref:hypothetical protein n=1 Tax=Breoghania sp. TaxID=2065378 RepID=UPI002AABF748|nr:hypothetical protein [Breoghania sp.]
MSEEARFEVLTGFPDVAEHLHNVIQDAQASGAIVHIITIIPTGSQSFPDDGPDDKSCKPKAQICPKGAR